ncbi:MAG: ABC transporter ATP-binding protein [Pseudomonadota bacterium]
MDKYRDVNPLQVSGLNKRYGRTDVLTDLSLTVEAGAVHGLVGLNGSGKTTTLECILGMLPYDRGDVAVLGHRPDHLWRAAGAVVGIFDSPSLHPGLTVRQSLEHARILCPQTVRSPARVESLLGISRYSNYRIRQLSLGNRRRASIAQALLGQPAFVILDEPFNGLDAGGVDDVLALISQLNREEGTTFLLSSHQLPYLERICSHLSILHKGRIEISDPVERLFAARHPRLLLRCDQTDRVTELLQSQPGILAVTAAPDGSLQVEIDEQAPDPASINRQLVQAGIAVSGLISETPSLESLFREITGGETDNGQGEAAA